MTEYAQKEGIVPASGLDLLAHGEWGGMGANEIGCEPAKDREVFRGIVLSAPVAVLVEDDVEHPMQPILDAPMTAHDPQQLLGGDVFREQEVACERLVRPCALAAPARCNAADRHDS